MIQVPFAFASPRQLDATTTASVWSTYNVNDTLHELNHLILFSRQLHLTSHRQDSYLCFVDYIISSARMGKQGLTHSHLRR